MLAYLGCMKSTNVTKTIIQGSIMGIVETIPGVSGSTLALIMGIYDRFIGVLHDVSNVFKEITKFIIGKSSTKSIITKIKNIDLKFAFYLFTGMSLGIGVFSHVMTFLMDHHPNYTFAFFFGLVLASVRVPYSQIKDKDTKAFILIGVSFIVSFYLLGFKPQTVTTNPSYLLLFFGGALAICSMILPGISGSFVLLLLGLYDYVLLAVKDLTFLNGTPAQLVNLIILGAGVTLGFGFFVRLLKKGLDTNRSEIMAILIGLMIASLRTLWPFISQTHVESIGMHAKIMPWEQPLSETILVLFIILITMYCVQYLDRRVVNNQEF